MVCLLSYSLVSLVLLILGTGDSSAFFLVPFYLFVPGHALVKVFFPDLDVFENIFLSVGLSVALLVGLRGFIRTFVGGLLSELPILAAISAVSLVAEIVSSK